VTNILRYLDSQRVEFSRSC